jgi:hypothetical protein
VLEAVFTLLEFSSPSRRIFIGSHSLSPSLVRRIGPSASHIPNSRFTNEARYMKCLCGKKKLSLLYKVAYTENIHDDKWIFDPK